MVKAALVAVAFLLVGCNQTAGDFCITFGDPIIVDENAPDRLTEGEIRQIIEKNRKWELFCD